MTLRSDDQRDKQIDDLLARVHQLETVVATLRRQQPDTGSRVASVEPTGRAPEVTAAPTPKIKASKSPELSLENAIGTRLIGRIGVLAILFGVAFFLKYSFDNKLIGETGRVILGIIWGGIFISAGEYFQKKKNLLLYGQMLSGGGLAVLYLALYAGFALYHLLPAALASVAMIAVTTTGMTLARRYSSYPLAAIALLGGLLTPVMLSTGQNQPFTLFGYVLLLDIGILVLLYFRQWPSLIMLSLFGTILLYMGWHSEFYDDGQRWLAFGVVLVFYTFYNMHILASCILSQGKESQFNLVIILVSCGFFFLAVYAQYGAQSVWPVKILALSLAALELGFAEIIQRRTAATARLAVTAFEVASVIMTVIATFLVLEQRWVSVALAAEMTALTWIGLRLDLPWLRGGAYLIGVTVLIRFGDDVALHLAPFQHFLPIFNARFLICAVVVALFYAQLTFAHHHRTKLGVNERFIIPCVFVTAQVLSLFLLSSEVRDFFRYRSAGHVLLWGAAHYSYQLSLSVLWALYASLLTGAGIVKRHRGARVLGLLLLGGTIVKVFFMDLSSLETLYRIISFVVLGMLLLAVSYGYNRFKHLIFGEEQS